MAPLRPVLILALATNVMGASDNMGPAAFFWPPDRAWSEQTDNTAPCGSVTGVGNRTEFPLSGGKIAFTAQDDSYNTQLSISFSNDPQSQSDFTPLTTTPIPELDPGHTCVSIDSSSSSSSPLAGAAAGTPATIQMRYTADFDRPENQTFYACADVVLVPAAAFNPADVPCFNASDPIDVPAPTATGAPTGLPGHGEDGPPLVDGDEDDSESVEGGGGGGGGLSAGAIAGAVVGSVVGFALIVGLGFLFYRERERKKRLVRERDAGRTVKWVDDAQGRGQAGKDSTSVAGESIRMGNLSAQG
ncbi:uncharacterized protein B0H64DRAFT_391991 [Chaetomium fimeti]|uniref:Copper acquisition factor BIM1-like domain-containing protein n=1 Tax=Chaetomium fimeti TaxID=1854472 RepID=A0AAE0HIS5_9PEZI|nr:hypothetical protein B0H64DRAFT_391991 [Chaetomium fimeti]